ncbi:hypothetical protein ACWDSJ_24485 [Nocardia sp. NPDC003482]
MHPANSDLTVPTDALPFAELGDRLARHLFDAGLRLDSLHTVFDRETASAAELRHASAAVGEVLDRLDAILRETALTVLAFAAAGLAHDREPTH